MPTVYFCACASQVSPQFDPTAPPSERRRRGRRNRKENARTACSQNPNSRKDILADIDNVADENKVCDRRKLDYINSDESLTDIEDQSPEEIGSSNVESDKENCNSDMSLCSLVASCSVLHEKGSFQRTPVTLCNGGRHESSHTKGKKRYCPTCSGSCLALAGDTPVQEYNLRVSERNRRGRLPKTAWEKLMAGT